MINKLVHTSRAKTFPRTPSALSVALAIVFGEFLFLLIWAAEGVVCGIEGKLCGVGY